MARTQERGGVRIPAGLVKRAGTDEEREQGPRTFLEKACDFAAMMCLLWSSFIDWTLVLNLKVSLLIANGGRQPSGGTIFTMPYL